MNVQQINEEHAVREPHLHGTNDHPTSKDSATYITLGNQDVASLNQHEKSGTVLITTLALQTFLIAFIAFTYNIVFFKLEGNHNFSSQISIGVLFTIVGLGLLSRSKIARTAALVISWILAIMVTLLIPLLGFGLLISIASAPYEAIELLLIASPLLLYPLTSLIILNMKRVSRLFN